MNRKEKPLEHLLAPGSWRGAVRKWFGQKPGRIRVVLGIACTGHGASVALVTADGIVRSSVLDRWAGVKNVLLFSRNEDRDIRHPRSPLDREINFVLKYGFGKFPATRVFEDIIDEWLAWFLRGLNIQPADIDLVVTSESHFATCRLRLLCRLHQWFPKAWIANGLEHHQIHQRQAFWQSGFEQAAVITLDSCGEQLSRFDGQALAGTISHMDTTGRCSALSHLLFPESSPGLLYEVVNRHLGFRLGDEGKTMGLAPYGNPDLFSRMEPLLELYEDGSFAFLPHLELQAALEDYISERSPDEEITQRHRNVAYAGQAVLERIVQNAFVAAMRRSGCRKIAYAGGVALNSVANEVARRAAKPDALYISPNPGDTGHALGCALFGAYEIAGWMPRLCEIPEYLGPGYTDLEMEDAARSSGFEVSAVHDIEHELAACIAQGQIAARFCGGAEFGPRALGNRSILCDPRRAEMKDHLNAKVKHREAFRPFAPSVLEERAAEWFDLNERSPFMLRVVPAREDVRERIPAVVHVDGSCRVQTVSKSENPGFYEVIQCFQKLTGIPLVLNTSFNIAGKPIVETPRDAMECFATTEIDVLALGPMLVSKRPLNDFHTPQPPSGS
jgi:carbamoyltransferase